MENVITCNWYYYVDFDGMHAVEMEFTNVKTGVV